MKVATLLAIVGAANAAQLPLGAQKTVSAVEDTFENIITGAETFAGLSIAKGVDAFAALKNKKQPIIDKFTQLVDGHERTFVKYPKKEGQDEGLVYELIQHESFPEYQVRLRKPKLCDPDVVQYSGYLDIAEDKHLFFWYVFALLLADGHADWARLLLRFSHAFIR